MADFGLTLSQPGQESRFQSFSDGRDGVGGISNCGCSKESEKDSEELEKVRSDFESLTDQGLYSDMTILVDGRSVPVHRSILAVRSPVWRKVFAEMAKDSTGKSSKDSTGKSSKDSTGRSSKDSTGRSSKDSTGKSSKVSGKFPPELELSSILGVGRRIGYAAFKTMMGYVYGGRLRSMSSVANECRDATCDHSTCRPAIDYAVELLNSASVFDIPELKNLAQQYLMDNLDNNNYQVDDVLYMSKLECTREVPHLHLLCLKVIANSDIDILTLEREIPGEALESVKRFRLELGHEGCRLEQVQLKQCRAIHRALDSDDIELVRLLLEEKKLDLDGAHALHYAAAHCDPRTMALLLELRAADTNLRNGRGLTVLHVAAWRREPQIIGSLLDKGARLDELTMNNQRAIDISRRLASISDSEREENKKDCLCIDLLEQAEKRFAIPSAAVLNTPSTEEELMSMLLYLENRVSLAKLLFPEEASIVMGMSQLEPFSPEYSTVTSDSPGSGITRRRRPSVDLNEEPTKRLASLVGVAISDESKEDRLESLRQRCEALRITVEAGRRVFPKYSAVVDKYVLEDEDWTDLVDKGITEEQLMKKRQFQELKAILQGCLIEKQNEKQKKPRTQEVVLSSSSSSTSSSSSLITRLLP